MFYENKNIRTSLPLRIFLSVFCSTFDADMLCSFCRNFYSVCSTLPYHYQDFISANCLPTHRCATSSRWTQAELRLRLLSAKSHFQEICLRKCLSASVLIGIVPQGELSLRWYLGGNLGRECMYL